MFHVSENSYRKLPVLRKWRSEECFCLDIWGVLQKITSDEKKELLRSKRRHTSKISYFNKICLFAWDIKVV